MNKAQYWFDRAAREHFAIGAFNAGSIETLKAIVGAAKKFRSPVMIEASHGEIEYFGIKEFVGICRILEQSHNAPILLNLDHAPDISSCKMAVDLGFDYVHFDGSKEDLSDNIRLARQLVGYAHPKGVLVEGEIDNINAMGASSSDNREKYIEDVRDPKLYTDPEKAAEFVDKTGVDVFASFVGNVHGLYTEEKDINLELLQTIKNKLGEVFLSLHGGSGISDNQISAAIGVGVVKINVNSELRVAFRDKLKEVLGREDESEVAVYKIMPEAIAAMQEIVEKKIKLFGSAGKI